MIICKYLSAAIVAALALSSGMGERVASSSANTGAGSLNPVIPARSSNHPESRPADSPPAGAYGVGVPSPMLVSTTLVSEKRAVISSVPPSAST